MLLQVKITKENSMIIMHYNFDVLHAHLWKDCIVRLKNSVLKRQLMTITFIMSLFSTRIDTEWSRFNRLCFIMMLDSQQY